MMNIPLVIVNYRGLKDTTELIESLKTAERKLHVIVVDNCSDLEGEEFERLLEKLPGILQAHETEKTLSSLGHVKSVRSFYSSLYESQLSLISLDKNLGFSGGTNVGIRFAFSVGDPEFIGIINNDTLVTDGFLSSIIAEMQANQSIGAAMGTILFYPETQYIWSTGGYISNLTANIVHTKKMKTRREIPNKVLKRRFVSGCFTVFRSSVLKEVDLLDEDYFFSYEEAQYSHDIRKLGYKLLLVPSSVIYHKSKLVLGNGSSHDIKDLKWVCNAYLSRIVFVNKNFSILHRHFWRLLFRLYLKRRMSQRLRTGHGGSNYSDEELKKLTDFIISNIWIKRTSLELLDEFETL